MSPLLDRQKQGVRLGSIRIGIRVVKDGKTRPEKLETFRLTSPDKVKIDAAAELYGGQVRPWKPNDNAGQQWEVVTTADRLPVRVPPGNPVEQNYEMWAATRQRLCDGITERMKGQPCVCPPDLTLRQKAASANPPAACKPITRLCLILADLPGLGVWQLSSTGDSAADELAATAELLQRAELFGTMLPATLRLEQRESRGSGTLHRFSVPVLDVAASIVALESGTYARAITAAAAVPAAQQALPVAPAPAGETSDPMALLAAARKATTPDEVKALRRQAVEHGWLQEYVPDLDDVHVPLENALFTEYERCGGEP